MATLPETSYQKMPSRPKANRLGIRGEWEGLEEIELWPEEGEGQGICGGRVGQGRPRLYLSFASFFSFLFLLFTSFGGAWGGGDRDAPLGRYCCRR